MSRIAFPSNSTRTISPIQSLQPRLGDREPRVDCFSLVNDVNFLAAGDPNASRVLKFSCHVQNCLAFLSQHKKPDGVAFQETIQRNGHTYLPSDTAREEFISLRANHNFHLGRPCPTSPA